MKLDKKILFNLLPGLLPLFVFVIADEIWGTIIGLYVALGFGTAELFITYFRSGKFEKFILLDIGFLIVLGATSILLDNDIFFKLKPAFIEFIFAALIGVSAFGKRNFIYEMSLRYVKDVQISPSLGKKMSKSLRGLLYVTLIHIALVVYSSFYMSDRAWAFISGVLFYIIILGYFGFETIKFRMQRKLLAGEEFLPVIDEKGAILGKGKRSDFHFNRDKKLLHPVIHMHVFNSEGRFFLQRRSKTKEVQPDKWDVAVGGHISYGESIEDALRREAMEEIGLNGFKPTFIASYIWETEIEQEMVFMFLCKTDQPLKINDSEVSEGRFWPPTEIRKSTGKNIFTPNLEKEIKMLSERGIIRFKL